MKRRFINTAIAITMLLSLAAAVVPGALMAPVALAATLHVGSGQTYTMIQDAINAASDGDTIVVHDGSYSQIVIDKPLTIISDNGSDHTTIAQDADEGSVCVNITASNVTFGTAGHGFFVSAGPHTNFVGILVATESTDDNYFNISIEDNEVDGFEYGIELFNDNGGNISACNITGNEVYGCDFGIALHCDGGDNHDNTVTGNEVYNCTDTCILLMAGESGSRVYDNTVQTNTVHDCTAGVDLNCDWNQLYDNTVQANTVYNCSDYGIRLYSLYDLRCDGNAVLDNTVYDCTNVGIYLYCTNGGLGQNTISGNEVYCTDGDSNRGIAGIYVYAPYCCGDIYDNTITLNTIYCWKYGIWFYAPGEGAIWDNTVTWNNISDCRDPDFPPRAAGIYLYADLYSSIYGNAIDHNTVYDSDYGVWLEAGNQFTPGGEMYDNAITNNTVYGNGSTITSGIYLHVVPAGGGWIHDCTVQGNTVYGWAYGIQLDNEDVATIEDIGILDNTLYNGSTGNGKGTADGGIYLRYCNNVSIRGNDIAYSQGYGMVIGCSDDIDIGGNLMHDNSAANVSCIYLYLSDYVDICRNDISNNSNELGGIYIFNSYYVTISCNNFTGNSEDGVYANTGGGPENFANDNWWDDPSGPGGDYAGSGEHAHGITVSTWLSAEMTPLADLVIGNASVPAAVSLYDTPQVFGHWNPEEYSLVYTQGPSYTDIIVEINCSEETCGIQSATANISALLLDLLPADFEERYVETWDSYTQDDWNMWQAYLSEVPMTYYTEGGICYYDYELNLADLFFENEECFDNCGGGPCYECWGLWNPIYYSCYSWSQTDEILGKILFEELRMGEHQVPVTLHACSVEYTVNVPLSVVDFQLPLKAGWNLRSTPVTLDGNYSSVSDILALGDGMPGLEAIVTYNSSSGLWEIPTEMTPLSACYIKMSERDQIGFVVNRSASPTPTRHLYEGWNLVGLAASFNYSYNDRSQEWYWWPDNNPFRAMEPWYALESVSPDWSLAMNPLEYLWYNECFYYKGIVLEKECYQKYFEQEPWLAYSNGNWSGGDFSPVFLTPGGGFWVFMENEDDLSGFSYTPYPWEIWYEVND